MISNQVLFNGVVDGMVYCLFAVGLVLLTRIGGVLNLAHGAVGAFGGSFLALLWVGFGFPVWVAVVGCVLASAALGAAVEVLVVRRLSAGSPLGVNVAMVGVSQVVALFIVWLSDIDYAVEYPSLLASSVRFSWLDVVVRGDQLLVLVAGPAMALTTSAVLRHARLGRAARAVGEDAVAAALSGVDVRRVRAGTWGIAGGLAGVSAVLIGPLLHLDAAAPSIGFGPQLLFFALVSASAGGWRSLPWTIVGALVVGVVNRVTLVNKAAWGEHLGISGGLNLLAVFLVLLLLVIGRSGRYEAIGRTPIWRPPPLIRSNGGRKAAVGCCLLFGFVLAVVPMVPTRASQLFVVNQVLASTMIVFSVVVVTGWLGEFSLGQGGFAVLGAYGAAHTADDVGYLGAMAVALGIGAFAGMLLAIVTHGRRGLTVPVVSFGFALVMTTWFTSIRKVRGPSGLGVVVDDLTVFGYEVSGDPHGHYYLVLAVVVLTGVTLLAIRGSSLGRRIVAGAWHHEGADAARIRVAYSRAAGFGLSGAIAGLSGALVLPASQRLRPGEFPLLASWEAVSVAVVGGVGSIAGASASALLLAVGPAVAEGSTEAALFASGIGMLIVLLYAPEGLAGAGRRLVGYLWPPRPTSPNAHDGPTSMEPIVGLSRANVGRFNVTDLRADRGSRNVLDGVSFRVDSGEIVGLVGANGSGKTTLLDAISGFVPASGSLSYCGIELSPLPARRRASAGLGRSFQHAPLFGPLTVEETIRLRVERQRGLSRSQVLQQVAAILTSFGLEGHAHLDATRLSSGARRIVEMAGIVASGASLLVLDEPSAAMAEAEFQQFGLLLTRLRDEVGVSVVLTGHDGWRMTELCDRLLELQDGKVVERSVRPEATWSDQHR